MNVDQAVAIALQLFDNAIMDEVLRNGHRSETGKELRAAKQVIAALAHRSCPELAGVTHQERPR